MLWGGEVEQSLFIFTGEPNKRVVDSCRAGVEFSRRKKEGKERDQWPAAENSNTRIDTWPLSFLSGSCSETPKRGTNEKGGASAQRQFAEGEEK